MFIYSKDITRLFHSRLYTQGGWEVGVGVRGHGRMSIGDGHVGMGMGMGEYQHRGHQNGGHGHGDIAWGHSMERRHWVDFDHRKV